MIIPRIKKEDIIIFLKNKKYRNWIILIFLLFLLVILLIFNLTIFFQPEPYYSPRILYCDKCERKAVEGKKGICQCPKCQKPVGYLWKCMSCSYEFKIIPAHLINEGTLAERRKRNIEQYKCPNCKSIETFRVTEINIKDVEPVKK